MSHETFQSLVESCHNALADSLAIHEVIDHLMMNENLSLDDVRSIAIAASKMGRIRR
jgi:hypothetical protein